MIISFLFSTEDLLLRGSPVMQISLIFYAPPFQKARVDREPLVLGIIILLATWFEKVKFISH